MKIAPFIFSKRTSPASTVEALESRITPSIITGVDLLISSISDGTTTIEPGALITYTIQYSNAGDANATGVDLTAPLDQLTDFVASENPGWSLDGSTLTKTIGNLNSAATGSTTLKLHVKSQILAGYSGVGTAVTISGDQQEENTGNNSASDYDTLTGLRADPTITQITDPVFAVEGRQATFTVFYNNLGNWGVSGAEITVTLPDFTSFSFGDGWTNNNDGTITASNLTIPAGSSEDFSLSYVVNVNFSKEGADSLLTDAAISSGFFSDANSSNNDASEETPIYSGFIVTAPGVAIDGKYAKPVIRVFDKATGAALYSFSAYEPKYRDSIRVAVGDFNGDGVDDIVTTTMHNGGRMRFFDGTTGERFSEGPLSAEVAVFGHAKNAGAFVAVGNISGSNLMQPTVFRESFGNYPEIVVGSSLGGGKVKVYSLDFQEEVQEEVQVDSIVPFGGNIQALTVIKEYTPFGTKFKGGVRVAVGDVDSFGIGKGIAPQLFEGTEDDIIVGQGFGGNKVKVYKGATSVELFTFSVGGAKYRGGVSVGAGYVGEDPYADIIVGRNFGKPSFVEVYDGRSGLDGGTIEKIGPTINPFENPKNIFGVRVAAGDVNGDGIADIIASVGVRNSSLVEFYDGAQLLNGTVQILERTITAYSQFPNVALWVAASNNAGRSIWV